MSQHTRAAAPGVIAGVDFSRFGSIVDVGGGDGTLAAEILRNCRAAMATDGRVLLVERVLPQRVTSADAPELMADMLMLVATGGKGRTEDEYRALLNAAGLTPSALSEPLPPFNYRVIEAAPA